MLLHFSVKVDRNLPGCVPLAFVAFTEKGGGLLIVPRHGGESFFRHTAFHLLTPGETHDSVAALDMMIEKIKWLARIVGLQLERHLSQFDCERVQVDAMNTSADHVAQRCAVTARAAPPSGISRRLRRRRGGIETTAARTKPVHRHWMQCGLQLLNTQPGYEL